MVGSSLRGIRDRLDALAGGGHFEVVCARTGRRPFPAADLRFPSRPAAEEAGRLVAQYRESLRRYDPTLAALDLIVCESVRDGRDGPSRQATVEFCHDVAGATFEALAAADHDATERAVMDHYLAAAERVPDRDALCLALLDSMATELDRRLDTADLVAVCRDAAARLPHPIHNGDPLDATLGRFRSLSLLDEYERRRGVPEEGDGDGTTRAVDVVLTGYALADDGVTTLPLVVDLLRRSDALPTVPRATPLDDRTWRLTVAFDGSPTGLTTVS
ncbi:hypothetical protein ACFPYI_08455 [Halomarina salina]|uniref:Uncharacterized protein n=1 Tax=Halomarina salina TaxID=1872699 RepID=A0ABD5RLS4_9EURY|nr:hypothetical protein [Halomarina salina]